MYRVSIDISEKAKEDYKKAFEYAWEKRFSLIETSSVFSGASIHLLKGSDIEGIREELIERMLRIEIMTLPSVSLSFDELKRFIRYAHLLNVRNILIPASFVPQDKLDSSSKITYIKQITKAAKSFGMGIIFENSSKSALSKDEEMNKLWEVLNDENVFFAYDPYEFVKEKSHPFFHMFYNSKLKNKIKVLRINDGIYSGMPARLCMGNGEIKELVSILLSRSFDGLFSLTPYLLDEEKSIDTSAMTDKERALTPYSSIEEMYYDLKRIFKSI